MTELTVRQRDILPIVKTQLVPFCLLEDKMCNIITVFF